MAKRACVIILVLVLLLTSTIPAFAVGEEAAELHNLEGNVTAEKEKENKFYGALGLGLTTQAPALALSGPFGLVIAGTGLTLAVFSQHATWENWPMGRWRFSFAPPGNILAIDQKAVAYAFELIANFIFAITKQLTRMAINICFMAFHTEILTGAISWVSEGVKEIFDFEKDMSRLMGTWGTIIFLIYAVFYFLRRELTSVIAAFLIAAAAVGGVIFYTANARPLIENFAKATDSVTGVFLGAVGGYTSQGRAIPAERDIDKGLMVFGQSAWSAIVAVPWSIAMFGTEDPENLKLTAKENQAMNKGILGDNVNLTGKRIDTLFLGTVDSREYLVEVLADPNITDHGNHPGTVSGLHHESTLDHIVVAFLTLLPAAAFFYLAVTVGLSILVSQLALTAMLLVLPVFLFAMMIPVHGWSVAQKYFSALGGFFMTKMIYGLYLSLVMSIGTNFVLAVVG